MIELPKGKDSAREWMWVIPETGDMHVCTRRTKDMHCGASLDPLFIRLTDIMCFCAPRVYVEQIHTLERRYCDI